MINTFTLAVKEQKLPIQSVPENSFSEISVTSESSLPHNAAFWPQ